MLHAAALVKAETFKNVVVTAGGCTAKLGMNGKDHVKKRPSDPGGCNRRLLRAGKR